MTNTVIDQMYEAFREKYSYISLDKNVVARFHRKFKSTNIDLLYDYILSQDLADGVVL